MVAEGMDKGALLTAKVAQPGTLQSIFVPVANCMSFTTDCICGTLAALTPGSPKKGTDIAALCFQTGGKSCVVRKDETGELLKTYEATRLLKVGLPRADSHHASNNNNKSFLSCLQDDGPDYNVVDPSTPELLDLWERRYKQSLSE